MIIRCFIFPLAFLTIIATAWANDPCGMVPPIYTSGGVPISRIGLQQTYVFYKDGIESFVIRPGFTGKVDEFGMLIPFPNPPAIRKVSDNVFEQIANGVDPPEVVVDLRMYGRDGFGGGGRGRQNRMLKFSQMDEKKNEVKVLKQEAVGMYEVAVLAAGSADALKKWMDQNGFRYPEGMDKVTNEYIEQKWCFVAVKTKVGQKAGVDPRPAQRKTDSKLPEGSNFDGHVQGMGFRFESDELVVPMRLSAFNEGDLRNVVYLFTDGPRKIRAIPEEYVVRQISGKRLIANLTQPLPLRIIGGTEKNLTQLHVTNLKVQRDPEPSNGVAKRLFASDMVAVSTGELSLRHEEDEKELLRIGEHFGLRGPEIDSQNAIANKSKVEKIVETAMKDFAGMTLTVVDGDFPRDVLASQNLTFAQYEMPARRNNSRSYDAKTNGPGPDKIGLLRTGALDWDEIRKMKMRDAGQRRQRVSVFATSLLGMIALIGTIGIFSLRRLKDQSR